MNRLAIIDGDVLIYKSFRPRWKDNYDEHGNYSVELDEDGHPKQKEYTKEEDSAYLKETYDNLKRAITEMQEKYFCHDYLLAIQGPGNFRKEIFPEYKLSRQKSRPSEVSRYVPVLQNLLAYEGVAIRSHLCEADDLIRIWAEEARAVNQDFLIVSIDKDLQCIPGKHFLMHKGIVVDVSEEEARKNYYTQLIQGDQTDNIPGVPGIGPKKAEKLLEGCVTEEDYQEAVVAAYVNFFDDKWREYLLSNGKLIHIRRHVEDYFDLSDWPIAQVIP
jgi:DNA polymerase-1